MFKHIKTSLIAILISLVFELIIYLFDFEASLKLSILIFFFHSLNLILTILLVINYQNYSISRLDNLKKGILLSVVFSFFISFYFFSYHKWINPVVLENKKNNLLSSNEQSCELSVTETEFVSEMSSSPFPTNQFAVPVPFKPLADKFIVSVCPSP